MPTSSELDDIRERIGKLVDTVDNYSMYAKPPMWLHKDLDSQGAILSGFRTVRTELKALYIELGGEDEWATFDSLEETDG